MKKEILESKIKDSYDRLLKSGMFWEFYPQLTGEWEEDKDFWYLFCPFWFVFVVLAV